MSYTLYTGNADRQPDTQVSVFSFRNIMHVSNTRHVKRNVCGHGRAAHYAEGLHFSAFSLVQRWKKAKGMGDVAVALK